MLTWAVAGTASPKITAGVGGGETPRVLFIIRTAPPCCGGAASPGQGKALSTHGVWRNGGPELPLEYGHPPIPLSGPGRTDKMGLGARSH